MTEHPVETYTFVVTPPKEPDVIHPAVRLVFGLPSAGSLRKMLEFLEMPQRDLAFALEVSAETVSRWLNGKHPIKRTVWAVVGSWVLDQDGRPTQVKARLEALAAAEKVKTVSAKKLRLAAVPIPPRERDVSTMPNVLANARRGR